MKEHPILFSAPMVRALLAATKTQTRRLIKQPATVNHPLWSKGDHLWVRETFCYSDGHATPEGTVCYRANLPADEVTGFEWKPSIFMRRVDSRITLEVTEEPIPQRLQDISEEDARAEGVTPDADCLTNRCARPYRDRYFDLWNDINGKGSWEANPWVWVVSFVRLP